MRKNWIKPYCILVLAVTACIQLYAQRNYTALVNPFIGTGGHGHTYPGASMPFGMMQLSPDTRMADWDGSSGYHYSDSVIYGFSHTHLSGTGIPDYCDVLFMPFTGTINWEPSQYRSSFSHKKEKAAPGYYEVWLDKDNIRAQLTTDIRSGMHQYSFPASAKTGSILIDLKHRDEVLESSIEKVSDYELRGLRRSRSWAQNQYVYFYIRFEKPIRKWVVRNNGSVEAADSVSGKHIQAVVEFDLGDSKQLRTKIGISAVNTDGAKKNLEREIPHWKFETVRNQASRAWNKELSKIDVKGGSPDQQKIFYTALYHTFLAPNIYQDVDGLYRGTDGKVHKAQGFTNYTVFSLWDTYRAYHPLMTIINRKRTGEWINTFLKQYEHGGMLPVWELAANETFCMIGYHSVPVMVDAYQKGIRGFDAALALKAMKDYAESERFGLKQYRTAGYISNDVEHESVSKTLEYAYDDWCIAQFAKMLGQQKDYKTYIRRAQYYKNLFDPVTRHMRGKNGAIWHQPFDAREINNFFTEGNSWQYSFAVPQDIEGLIRLHGGEAAFTEKLEELFSTSSKTTGRDQADVTGLIGQYAQGNEPSHHMAYLFNYVGKPWRTQEILHRIFTEFYTNAPDGLIGNEDCGQMSAWYVFSAMGLYPVCPGDGQYILGVPVFDTVTIHLENGKKIRIHSKGRSAGIQYVNAIRLNGRNHTRSYIRHSELANGAVVDFSLSAQPQKEMQWEKPVSRISDHIIQPVPYFDVATYKFRDSMQVAIRTVEPGQKIWYAVMDSNSRTLKKLVLYEGPITFRENATVFVISDTTEKRREVVVQNFYKLPTDRTIRVLSKVHPMYTAGGADALIDGITGSVNWRAGEWQSYYDQDFEAIIDLQQEKQLGYVGLHVLQEASPWILYPRELIIAVSSDGKTFTDTGRWQNPENPILKPVETREMGVPVNTRARYVRIRAVNGGKLPAWHESAGQGSHLFVSEVIIR